MNEKETADDLYQIDFCEKVKISSIRGQRFREFLLRSFMLKVKREEPP